VVLLAGVLGRVMQQAGDRGRREHRRRTSWNGVPQATFLGYPVRISQKFPTSPATARSCLFGNLALACTAGDRRSTSIRMSDVALNAFEQDEVAIVGFERFDIVVHDSRHLTTAGPLVALKSASS
jgi:HK97 family phage major capsid protein